MQKTKKSKKIIIGLLVTLILLAGIILLIPKIKSASASTIEPNDNYNYTLVTNEAGESSYKVAVKPAYRSQIEFAVIPEPVDR